MNLLSLSRCNIEFIWPTSAWKTKSCVWWKCNIQKHICRLILKHQETGKSHPIFWKFILLVDLFQIKNPEPLFVRVNPYGQDPFWIAAHVPGLHGSLLSWSSEFGTAPWKRCSNLFWVLIPCLCCINRQRLQLRFHQSVHSNCFYYNSKQASGRQEESPSSFEQIKKGGTLHSLLSSFRVVLKKCHMLGSTELSWIYKGAIEDENLALKLAWEEQQVCGNWTQKEN